MDPNLTLGRAISISGAAVDPNMSFYQSAPLTALLTIFNARLGYWIQKPKPKDWTAESPRFGKLLLTEFFGQTDGRGEFVHISDGGHFENLGVYELIRRRCRYIISLDSGEDGDPSNDNLAALIRLCRIDFGVRIQIDTAPLRMEGPDRLTRAHLVIGRIRYDDVDRGEIPGVLVYVKISLTGDEPPDLQKYARKDERFPHQPTDLLQSFDEEVFECYRCLGDHIASAVFSDAVRQTDEPYSDPRRVPHLEYVPRLFSKLQNLWTEAPEALNEQFLELSRAWASLQSELGSRPELGGLSGDLYPELPPPRERDGIGDGRGPAAPDPSEAARADLFAVGRMLQMMEDAWISLGLKRYSALPMNRGWLNTFRRWSTSDAFRRIWPTIRSEFGSDFVDFCETQLNLSTARLSLIRLSGWPGSLMESEDRALKRLDEEFGREWPKDISSGRGLTELIGRASRLGLPEIPVWLIVQAPSGHETAADAPEDERISSGIILVSTFDDHPEPELDPSPVELFVWVRPPFRTAGLASQCLTRELVARIRESVGGRPLWVRYPVPAPNDSDIEFANWVNFFARYDFKRVFPTDDRDHSWTCTLLKLG
ncbi:MAG: hypothetical protein ACLQGP_39965 [Isosphaeraceae bacterium]